MDLKATIEDILAEVTDLNKDEVSDDEEIESYYTDDDEEAEEVDEGGDAMAQWLRTAESAVNSRMSLR